MEDILKASGTLLTPYSTTPLKVMLSSVVADQNNVGSANKGAGRGAGSTFAVPVGLTVADSSVIVAEVTYSYKPTLGLSEIFSPRAFEMKRTFYARPRKSFKVTKTESGCPSV